MADPVVWFELTGPDPAGASRFYAELFGWHTETMTMEDGEYITLDTHAGKGINGGFAKAQGDQPPTVVFYVGADDLQAKLDKAGSLGAKTIMPVTEIPDIVTFAMFTDPQGTIIGLLQNRETDQATGPSQGDNPQVGWFEILAPDPKASWDFYGELFGWDIEQTEGEGFVYGQIEAQAGQGISGGIGSSPDDIPHVNMYAEVDDLQKYLERAESLGGKTQMPPTDVSEGTSVAIFLDPQGTGFGLYRRTE